MFKFICSAFALTGCLWLNEVSAQVYLGLSANAGNRLSYSSPENFRRSIAISGSAVFAVIKALPHDWAIQYGASAGVLGYSMKVQLPNTPPSDAFPFPEYSTLYGSAELLWGKQLRTGKKRMLVGLGGGITYYYTSIPLTTYSIAEVNGSGVETIVFSAQITAQNKIVPFGKIALQLPLNRFLMLGVQYSYHLSSVLSGSYEFQNGPSTAGEISLRQSELSLLCLVRVSRKKTQSK
jgi:hypothetical protein